MSHLSEADLVDAADPGGLPPGAAARHLTTCESCRAAVGVLREALAEAAQDRPAEPSPLFWDHFAARVSSAIRDERPPAAALPWSWIARPAAGWLVLLLVLACASAFAWRATLHAPATVGREVAAPLPATDVLLAGEPDADAAWGAVRLAADRLTGEEAQALDLGAEPGAAEQVATEMSAEERDELARLLETELKRTGV